MSHQLVPIHFPLHGARLIEASAGTGKTWTIAALYVRLILGHGQEDCRFVRPLQPAEILVMTFTRAATRELSDRIRARLVEAAECFRGKPAKKEDTFLGDLLACYHGDETALQQAAHRLTLAAEAMDDSAVFTIDAWCQRMLREHAFDSGALFDEELIQNEHQLFSHALKDYWRNHVYALSDGQFDRFFGCWKNLADLDKAVQSLVWRANLLDNATAGQSLGHVLDAAHDAVFSEVRVLKAEWKDRVSLLEEWFQRHRDVINGNTYRVATVNAFFGALKDWLVNEWQAVPGAGFDKAADKWDEDKLRGAAKGKASYAPHPDFEHVAQLKRQLDSLPQLAHFVLPHAAITIAKRMHSLKAAARKFGFADMLSRLKDALEGENGPALRDRILARYPVALIDEFQDTSPDQYKIFDTLYQVSSEGVEHGLFLIGDPKQAIYAFRGADIHSYLAARRATQGRHYRLTTNYRSTNAVVKAVNHLFSHAEGRDKAAGHARGAFRFRNEEDNPLPFELVEAHDRPDRLMHGTKEICAMTVWVGDAEGHANQDAVRRHFAAVCAEQIVTLLNDESVRFASPDGATPLQPADIAILVRDRFEAAAVQHALRQRQVRSVYLSDKDSVFESEEAQDVLRWLYAISNPLDSGLARAAFATRTAGLSLAQLASFTADDVIWEERIEQLKQLKQVWQRQGVLATLRRFLHELGLPETLACQVGQERSQGERRLTNLLHLAELLQRESQHLEGEQALIRWFASQIEGIGQEGEEHIVRLESDAQLVKVITVHKSKGLEYPLVFLPFAAACRPVKPGKRSYLEYTDPKAGLRKIDFTLSDSALSAMEAARIEEDLRLLYVALTRARHALWIGVASVNNEVHLSALGYLINGETEISAAELKDKIHAMCSSCEHIEILDGIVGEELTPYARKQPEPVLQDLVAYETDFERNWSIASYSSLTKNLSEAQSPTTRTQQKIAEEGAGVPVAGAVQDRPWHRFARGLLPGLFLHGLLEWMAEEGLEQFQSPDSQERLMQRCERTIWKKDKEDIARWLTHVAQVALPPIAASLGDLTHSQAETEFWIPANNMPTAELDQLCRENLLPGMARPAMSDRQVTGMLRGFIDLVFEHEGRYWILDYKSTALGNHDAAYHDQALQMAVLDKRYEVQGMIYLLALHRLLAVRLGKAYEPQQHLGGAIFFFVRGVGNEETRGCCTLEPDMSLLHELDALLSAPLLEETV